MNADRSGFEGTTSTASRSFVVFAAAAFGISAAATVYLCRSMNASMPMPGGWSMSMGWMRMPGQSWLAAGLMFAGMWIVMMIAMMLPAIAPSKPTFAYAAGYFAVWSATGVLVYPAGVAIALAAMRSPAVSRAVPLAGGIAIVVAGLVQLSPWKMRALSCCRLSPASTWRDGIRGGIDCVLCCSGLMTVLFVAGPMDLAAMAVVALAIAIERIAPRPQLAARVAGVAMLAYGGLQLIH